MPFEKSFHWLPHLKGLETELRDFQALFSLKSVPFLKKRKAGRLALSHLSPAGVTISPSVVESMGT